MKRLCIGINRINKKIKATKVTVVPSYESKRYLIDKNNNKLTKFTECLLT